MDLTSFRAQLLTSIKAAKAQQAEANLHLLYIPELSDPLELVEDSRRISALLRPASHSPLSGIESERLPRLITFDCKRVAAYLFESDVALDDPLFEASITQAHAEWCLNQRVDAELENDDRVFADVTIGGWLLSNDSAETIAKRIQDYSTLHADGAQRHWVRWYNPVYLSALWPTLHPEQRYALLGNTTWITFDATGQLQRYAASALSEQKTGVSTYGLRRIDLVQAETLKNVPLVHDLLQAWQTLCAEQDRSLPPSAEQDLHLHVLAAQRYRLDAESVAIYVMTAVQLKPGATEDAEWVQLMRHSANNGLLLRDMLEELPDRFWEQWALDPADNQRVNDEI